VIRIGEKKGKGSKSFGASKEYCKGGIEGGIIESFRGGPSIKEKGGLGKREGKDCGMTCIRSSSELVRGIKRLREGGKRWRRITLRMMRGHESANRKGVEKLIGVPSNEDHRRVNRRQRDISNSWGSRKQSQGKEKN